RAHARRQPRAGARAHAPRRGRDRRAQLVARPELRRRRAAPPRDLPLQQAPAHPREPRLRPRPDRRGRADARRAPRGVRAGRGARRLRGDVSWELLTELACRESELVDAGDWYALLALQAERQHVIASVTGPPPPDVVAVARARSLATEAALRRGLD